VACLLAGLGQGTIERDEDLLQIEISGGVFGQLQSSGHLSHRFMQRRDCGHVPPASDLGFAPGRTQLLPAAALAARLE